MNTEYKRIIYALLSLLGLYLCMVSFTAISDYRSEHDSYHYSWEKHSDEMGAWTGAGTFLLLILSALSCIGCVIGVAYNVCEYLKEKHIL